MLAPYTAFESEVFPAPAGVILTFHVEPSARIGFPRTCGGDPIDIMLLLPPRAFSPHLRG